MEYIDKLHKALQEPFDVEKAHQQVRPTLATGQPIRIKHANPPKSSAVMLVFYEDGGVRFPLIQRTDYKGVHGGQISLPGGKFEEGDQNLLATAQRETREEIGVPVQEGQVLGKLSNYYVIPSNHLVTPYVAFIENKPTFQKEEREVSEIITPQLSTLLDINSLKKTKLVAATGYELIAPYFDLEEKIVWGATAAILNELVHRLKR